MVVMDIADTQSLLEQDRCDRRTVAACEIPRDHSGWRTSSYPPLVAYTGLVQVWATAVCEHSRDFACSGELHVGGLDVAARRGFVVETLMTTQPYAPSLRDVS